MISKYFILKGNDMILKKLSILYCIISILILSSFSEFKYYFIIENETNKRIIIDYVYSYPDDIPIWKSNTIVFLTNDNETVYFTFSARGITKEFSYFIDEGSFFRLFDIHWRRGLDNIQPINLLKAAISFLEISDENGNVISNLETISTNDIIRKNGNYVLIIKP
jgi:hypothetical protein